MKSIKTFFYVIGIYYAASSILAYFIFGLQAKLYEATGEPMLEKQAEAFYSIQEAFLVFTPGLLIIGILHILYGYFFEKITKNRFTYFVLLSIATTGWFILQTYFIYPEMMKIFDSIPVHAQQLDEFMNMIMVVAMVMGIAQVTIPQFFLGKMIYKLEKEEDNPE